MDRWVLALSALSVPFTLTHSFEDFSEGIERTRFGLELLPAAFLLSLIYAAQIAAAALAARRQTSGYWLNLLLALGWLIAAAADHLTEVLFIPTEIYRAGVISKSLEVGIMVVALAWAVASARCIRAHRHGNRAVQ